MKSGSPDILGKTTRQLKVSGMAIRSRVIVSAEKLPDMAVISEIKAIPLAFAKHSPTDMPFSSLVINMQRAVPISTTYRLYGSIRQMLPP